MRQVLLVLRDTAVLVLIAAVVAIAIGIVFGAAGCAPISRSWPDAAPVPGRQEPGEPNASQAAGELAVKGDYLLHNLGAAAAGDRWTISPAMRLPFPLVCVLLDAGNNLLARQYVHSRCSLQHTLRTATSALRLGVMAPLDGPCSYRLAVRGETAHPVPAPMPQAVYLNFGGGDAVQVSPRPPISFGPFTGADLGDEYAEATQELRAAIAETVRGHYAGFAVAVVDSTAATPPAGPYTTVHFGGYAEYLGWSAGVDAYNRLPEDNAIVFVESFAHYESMELTSAEMGQMLGNTASHELGHLLGLYHTADAGDVMAQASGARRLAGPQRLSRVPLATSVFPVGWQDAPAILRESVGTAEESR